MCEMRRIDAGGWKRLCGEKRKGYGKEGKERKTNGEMRIELEWIIIGIFMAICTVADIRKKEIPAAVIVLSGLPLLCHIIFGNERQWMDILYSLMPGIFLLMLSYCTKESIGYGDGLVVAVIGICMGTGICIAALAAGLIISAVYGAALLALRKAGGKTRMPFVPFLSAGLGVVFIAQKGI